MITFLFHRRDLYISIDVEKFWTYLYPYPFGEISFSKEHSVLLVGLDVYTGYVSIHLKSYKGEQL